MTDREIRKELMGFAERVFAMRAVSEAFEIRGQLDTFIAENNVTFEQLQVFTDSGAGEALYMLTH